MNSDNNRERSASRIFVAGLSYKTAPVEVREKLAVRPALQSCCGCRLKLKAGLDEVVLVSTCNRVEVYGTAPWVQGRVHQIFQQLFGDVEVTPYVYVKEDAAAAEHLFAVTSGLDSMVIGETEITGQIKTAYQNAQAAGLTGRVTNRWFQTALQVAKKVRTHTNIGRGAVSVGSVSVELVEKIYEQGLAGKTVVIIGAGKMGEACVQHLVKKGAQSVLVVNRSPAKAELLAAQVGGQAVRFEDLLPALREADIVISSTGADGIILDRAAVAQVMAGRPQRPLSFVDIAVPRDIAADVAAVAGVYLYNIDDLQEIMGANTRQRELALADGRKIIATQTAALMQRWQPTEGAADGFRRRKNFDKAGETANPLPHFGLVENTALGG